MAADSGRYRASHSAQVCTTCKARKKKCDKVLPSCGYCVRKGLYCAYSYEAQSQNDRHHTYSTPFSLFSSQTIPSELAAAEANLYRQVLQLIHETGQFVDDISTRYFQGLHRYLPVCSRSRFHRNLITLGAIPSPGFSVLLLTICLTVSSSSRLGITTEYTGRRSLYLNTKSLLVLVQESYPPSIPLIQSHLLLAVYDYTHGRPEEAFVAIAGCARMAYAARIHLCYRSPPQKAALSLGTDVETHLDPDGLLRAEEAANTWWGIVICERTFCCEVVVPEQPLVTTIPSGDVLLPTEPETLEKGDFPRLNAHSVEVPYMSVSCIDSNVGGFGRTAQAAWLLDKVFMSFEIPSLDSRLAQLQGLDITIQTFLGALMQQCYANEKAANFCQAIAITIRALFTMHSHIPRQPPQILGAESRLLEDWCKKSHATLDTATKMVLDIVEAHENLNMVAPSLPYNHSGRTQEHLREDRLERRQLDAECRGTASHIAASAQSRPECPSYLDTEELRILVLRKRSYRHRIIVGIWGLRDRRSTQYLNVFTTPSSLVAAGLLFTQISIGLLYNSYITVVFLLLSLSNLDAKY